GYGSLGFCPYFTEGPPSRDRTHAFCNPAHVHRGSRIVTVAQQVVCLALREVEESDCVPKSICSKALTAEHWILVGNRQRRPIRPHKRLLLRTHVFDAREQS